MDEDTEICCGICRNYLPDKQRCKFSPLSRNRLDADDVCRVFRFSDESLAALGYVPEPVWRDAVNDPPPEHVDVLVVLADTLLIARRREPSWFHSRTGEWISWPIQHWLPLPAIPGKGE